MSHARFVVEMAKFRGCYLGIRGQTIVRIVLSKEHEAVEAARELGKAPLP
jgi:hypothetical protein